MKGTNSRPVEQCNVHHARLQPRTHRAQLGSGACEFVRAVDRAAWCRTRRSQDDRLES